MNRFRSDSEQKPDQDPIRFNITSLSESRTDIKADITINSDQTQNRNEIRFGSDQIRQIQNNRY